MILCTLIEHFTCEFLPISLHYKHFDFDFLVLDTYMQLLYALEIINIWSIFTPTVHYRKHLTFLFCNERKHCLFFGQAIEKLQSQSQKQIKKQTKKFCVERNEKP